MKLVHGSLFSGFDAPSVAASWMGWKNAFHCEINLFCNEILKYWKRCWNPHNGSAR